MIETSARILKPGERLYLDVRRVAIKTMAPTPEILQKACGKLSSQHDLTSLPRETNGSPCLLVMSREPLAEMTLTGKDWSCSLTDTGGERLRFSCRSHRSTIASLAERLLIRQIHHANLFWSFDSLRFFHEKNPICVSDDVAAYRRFVISGFPIDGVGIGLSVNAATLFVSTLTVAEFFDPSLLPEVRSIRSSRFRSMSLRQQGQKGTLVYDSGGRFSKAYFESYRDSITCETTDSIVVDGDQYGSLFEYYKRNRPGLGILSTDAVAVVSFPGIPRPVPVAAKLLRLRVLNDSLPPSLRNIDKLSPEQRASEVTRFWELLGERPLGRYLPGLYNNLWQPAEHSVHMLQPPDLMFAGNTAMCAPKSGDVQAYQQYYRGRMKLLDQKGCFYVPSDIDRVLHVMTPRTMKIDLAKGLAQELTDQILGWTGCPLRYRFIEYDDINEGIGTLRNSEIQGTVLVVLNGKNPVDYYTVAYELKNWRIKRVQQDTVAAKRRSPERQWKSFLTFTALDLLQVMNCVPWTIASRLNYDAQLAIDVGHDRRHFALSFLQAQQRYPFRLHTNAVVKSDVNHETINRVVLKDEIVKIVSSAQKGKPLSSILVLRDGHNCGEELKAVIEAVENLKVFDFVSAEASVDLVDFHKQTARNVKIWETDMNGMRRHAPEDTCIFLDDRTAILLTTGAPTLRQGTAEPILITTPAGAEAVDMLKVCQDLAATTHLNWSSPSVAQRNPICLKRTDEVLKERAQQEIRRTE